MKISEVIFAVIVIGAALNLLLFAILVAAAWPILSCLAFIGFVFIAFLAKKMFQAIDSDRNSDFAEAEIKTIWFFIGIFLRIGGGFFISEAMVFLGLPALSLFGLRAFAESNGFNWSNVPLFGVLFAVIIILYDLPGLLTYYKVEKTGIKKSLAWAFNETIPWSKVSDVVAEYFEEGQEQGKTIYTISVYLTLVNGCQVGAGFYECVSSGDVFENPYAFEDVEKYQKKEFIDKLNFLEQSAFNAKWTAVFSFENGREKKRTMPNPTDATAAIA